MNRAERRRLAKQQKRQGPSTSQSAAQESEIARLLSEAVGHLEGKRPKEAARLCRQVLKRRPDQPDALNLAGIAAFQLGDGEGALKLLREATARRPDHVDSHNNLGNVLRLMGLYKEAEES